MLADLRERRVGILAQDRLVAPFDLRSGTTPPSATRPIGICLGENGQAACLQQIDRRPDQPLFPGSTAGGVSIGSSASSISSFSAATGLWACSPWLARLRSAAARRRIAVATSLFWIRWKHSSVASARAALLMSR